MDRWRPNRATSSETMIGVNRYLLVFKTPSAAMTHSNSFAKSSLNLNELMQQSHHFKTDSFIFPYLPRIHYLYLVFVDSDIQSELIKVTFQIQSLMSGDQDLNLWLLSFTLFFSFQFSYLVLGFRAISFITGTLVLKVEIDW